ncbi:hypothetical protein H5410_002433 [Solanum commersonii]|uniref:Zinc finger PMZ-type domain-containing protein n=1 Tax=Solanum commersonii TaxID=4109 RepID=A0A9J6B242_SOLCO|nr:hypothetical protein H5410_002433 [Solanum commersonii]
MNNHRDEIGGDEVSDLGSNNPPTPIIGSNNPASSQSSRVKNVQDDETGFYKGMTFKNKEELANSLKIAFLKKDFNLTKVVNSSNVYSFKCSYPECNKGSSTRDMSNQLRTKLGCKVSYWKIYKSMDPAKSCGRGTHDHEYAVLNAYRYMLEIANPGSKTTLSLDENRGLITSLENILNNVHNSKVVSNFYKEAKTYNRCEFNDHFNQIRDMSVNTMFDAQREFLIVALFDEIKMRFALLFHQRRMELVNSSNRFVTSIEKYISTYVNSSNKLLAHQIANYKFTVTSHGDFAMVYLQRITCTYRIFDLEKISCPHAMSALRSQYGAYFRN